MTLMKEKMVMDRMEREERYRREDKNAEQFRMMMMGIFASANGNQQATQFPPPPPQVLLHPNTEESNGANTMNDTENACASSSNHVDDSSTDINETFNV